MRRIEILPTILIVLAGALALFPVLYLFANSFMSGAEILSRYGREITEVSHTLRVEMEGGVLWQGMRSSDPNIR